MNLKAYRKDLPRSQGSVSPTAAALQDVRGLALLFQGPWQCVLTCQMSAFKISPTHIMHYRYKAMQEEQVTATPVRAPLDTPPASRLSFMRTGKHVSKACRKSVTIDKVLITSTLRNHRTASS